MSNDANRSDNLAWLDAVPRVLLLGLTFLLGCFEFADYDVWWHLRTGQLIPERGVPRTDWYSFMAEGRPWIDVHWGFQVLYAWVFDRFSFPGVVLTTATIATLTMALLLAGYRRDWPVSVQICLWLPALLLMSSRFFPRPEILTLLLTASFLCVLFHAERRPRLLWILPVLQVVWANVQGLWIFGPILVGMYGVDALCRWPATRLLLRHLIPVGLLAGAAGCVSPFGFRNILFVYELWTKMAPEEAVYRESIAELQDVASFLRFGGTANPYAQLLMLLYLLAAISVVLQWRSIMVRRRLFRVLPLIAFGYLGMRALRNGNHFALVTGSMVAWNFGSLNWPAWFHQRKATLLSCLLVLATGYFVGSGRWYLWIGGGRRIGLRERPHFVSHEAARLAGQEGMPERVGCFHMGHAATYIFHNGPERKVFFDGRLEVHGRDTFLLNEELSKGLSEGRDMEAQWRALGLSLLIVDGEYNVSAQSALLADPHWSCIHYDEVVAVFLHRSYAAPAGVEPVDFRRRLFETPRPVNSFLPGLWKRKRPSWWQFQPDEVYQTVDNVLAARLFYLGHGLSQRPSAEETTVRAVLWRAAQFAVHASQLRPWDSDGPRFLGAALLQLANIEDPDHKPLHASGEPPYDRLLLQAMGVAALQRAADLNANDYTSRIILQEYFASVGALSSSLAPLEHIATQRPRNRTQVQLKERMLSLLHERQTQVSTLLESLPPMVESFDTLERYAKAGLIDVGLQRSRLAANTLTRDQRERLIAWNLLLGRPDAAQGMGDHLPDSFPTKGLWSATCAIARGDYLWVLEMIPDRLSDVKRVDQCFLGSIIWLLTGDGPTFDRWIEKGLELARGEAGSKSFERLRELSPSADARQ